MSKRLSTIDLSTYAVGSSGLITLDSVKSIRPSSPAQAAEPAHCRLYNDSGSTLSVWTDTGDIEDYIPAGGWLTMELDQSANEIHFTVINILPNPPIQLLMPVYYKQGENVPAIPQIGNSPVGIGGTVATVSTAAVLSNEGGPSNVLIIDIGDAAFAQLFTLYSDGHALWYVDQSGVRHQALKINIAGTPLQLGQAGDIVEVLGAFLVDQNVVITGTVTVATINSPAATNLVINVPTGQKHSFTVNAVEEAFVDVNGITIPNGDFFRGKDTGGTIRNILWVDGSNNTLIQSGAGDNIGFNNSAGVQRMTITNTGLVNVVGTCKAAQFSFPQGTVDHVGSFSGAATGTYSHGLSATPFFVIPMQNAVGSQTMGYDTVTSTQVHITSFSGASFNTFLWH